MRIVSSIAAMQRLARQWRRAGKRIGFVPTMGYLHAGHLSLVREARKRVGQPGKVVVSIYVNPTQFGPKEDFSKYPRDFKRDFKLCRAAGVDVVFTPGDKEMYPDSGTGVPPVRSRQKLTGETPCHQLSAPTSSRKACRARWKARRGQRTSAVSRRSWPSCSTLCCRMSRCLARKTGSKRPSSNAWWRI